MKIFILADPDTYLAFALAGIKGQAIKSSTEVAEVIENLNHKLIGMILITEDLAEKNRKLIDRILLQPKGPLIVEIPDFRGSKSKRPKTAERILSLLRG